MRSAITMDAKTELILTGDGTRSYVATHNVFPANSTPAVVGAGRLYLDPRVVLKQYGTGPVVYPAIATTPQTVPYLVAAPAPLGGTVQVRLESSPGDVFLLAIGLPGVPVNLPGLVGAIWLDLGASVVVASAILTASGVYRQAAVVPDDPAMLGFSVVWQGLAGPQAQHLSHASGYAHFR